MFDFNLKPLAALFGAAIGGIIGLIIGALTLIACFWVTVPAWLPIGIVLVGGVIGGIKGAMNYR